MAKDKKTTEKDSAIVDSVQEAATDTSNNEQEVVSADNVPEGNLATPEGTTPDTGISENEQEVVLADNVTESDNANHLTIDQAREEITKYNELAEAGVIPPDSSDSIDVALEKAENKMSNKNESVLAKLLENDSTQDQDVTDASDLQSAVSEKEALNAKALKYMEESNTKEIWRCPATGYWFTRSDYAGEHEKNTGRSLEHYKK